MWRGACYELMWFVGGDGFLSKVVPAFSIGQKTDFLGCPLKFPLGTPSRIMNDDNGEARGEGNTVPAYFNRHKLYTSHNY